MKSCISSHILFVRFEPAYVASQLPDLYSNKNGSIGSRPRQKCMSGCLCGPHEAVHEGGAAHLAQPCSSRRLPVPPKLSPLTVSVVRCVVTRSAGACARKHHTSRTLSTRHMSQYCNRSQPKDKVGRAMLEGERAMHGNTRGRESTPGSTQGRSPCTAALR